MDLKNGTTISLNTFAGGFRNYFAYTNDLKIIEQNIEHLVENFLTDQKLFPNDLSNLENALEKTSEIIKNEKQHSKSQRNEILIIINTKKATDITSNKPTQNIRRRQNVKVFSVGVGPNIRRVDVWTMASHVRNDHTFMVEDWEELVGKTYLELGKSVCGDDQ